MDNKRKKRYTIIALIVVSIMILSPILYLIADATSSKTTNNIGEKDITEQVEKETTLKIIDMHRNMDSYIDKEVTMELQFFLLEGYEDKFALGVLDTLDNGEEQLFHILSQMEDGSIPEGLENYDNVKITGTISSFQEGHDDHNHEVPILTVESIKKIENQDD